MGLATQPLPGLKVQVTGASIFYNGASVSVGTAQLTMADLATNYVQFNGTSIISNTTGFVSGNLPISIVNTSNGQIVSISDARPGWVLAGSGTVGSGASPAAPIMALYFTNVCPVGNTGQCFYTPSNTQLANDCTWSTSSTTVTCASSHFVAGDVGKRVAGYFRTDSFSSIFGCVAGRVSFNPLTTTTAVTIASYTSGTQISLSSNPSNPATSNNGCFIWGTPDDATASTFETAYAAIASFCPKIMFAAAGYWFSSPHFSSQPTGCTALPSIVGVPTSFGNMVYTAGVELEGRGPGNTVWYLGPDFPNGDSCARSEGSITNACFLVPVEGKWSDFQISGGAQLSCQVTANKVLIGVDVGTMQNITLTNFCEAAAGGQIGIMADLLSQLYQVNDSGFGAVCFQNAASTGGEIQAFKLACENSPGGSFNIVSTGTFLPTFSCWGCLALGAISSGNMNVIKLVTGATVYLNGGVVNNCEAGSGCTTTATQMIQNAGGSLYMDDVVVTAQGGATPVGGLGCPTAGGTTWLMNTRLSNVASQNYFDTGGCTLVDEGGNGLLFNGLVGSNMIGTVLADGRSVMFTCTGVANASVTNSLYGTGPNVTATTCSGQTSTLGAGIPFQGARTIQGLVCTSSATTVSVACTVMINGSPASTTCTMTAATRCANFTTTAVNPGDLLSARIVTGAAETGANIKMQVIWN